jgi:hypothetical protein
MKRELIDGLLGAAQHVFELWLAAHQECGRLQARAATEEERLEGLKQKYDGFVYLLQAYGITLYAPEYLAKERRQGRSVDMRFQAPELQDQPLGVPANQPPDSDANRWGAGLGDDEDLAV